MLPSSESKQTNNQASAHKILHEFPAELAKETDPYIAAYEGIMLGLSSLTRGKYISADNSLTGSTHVLGYYFEAPDTTRGHDDGYSSDTERGQYVRRFEAGVNHLKNVAFNIVQFELNKLQPNRYFVNTLQTLVTDDKQNNTGNSGRKLLKLAKKRSLTPNSTSHGFLAHKSLRRFPSPPRSRGAIDMKDFNENLKLPITSEMADGIIVLRLTNYAYMRMRTLK